MGYLLKSKTGKRFPSWYRMMKHQTRQQEEKSNYNHKPICHLLVTLLDSVGASRWL